MGSGRWRGALPREMDLPSKRGLCFDASEFMCIEVDRQKNQNQSLELIAGFISPALLVSTLKSRQMPPDFDLLKIDIDSLECPLLDAVLARASVRASLSRRPLPPRHRHSCGGARWECTRRPISALTLPTREGGASDASQCLTAESTRLMHYRVAVRQSPAA